MKQAQLVNALRIFGNENREPKSGRFRGQAVFALFLADYVEKLTIPADQMYDCWEIDTHIPSIIVGATRAFEKSDEPWVTEYRKTYEEETEHPFRDPTLVYAGNNIQAVLEIEMTKGLVREIMGRRADYLSHNIDALLHAERNLINLRFRQFQDQVYNNGGLSKIIAGCECRGMSGKFGKTTLRSYAIAGRLMLTFARKNEGSEQSISFVCEDEDLIGLGGGMQSCYAELPTAVALIEEVIANWPTGRETFSADQAIALDCC